MMPGTSAIPAKAKIYIALIVALGVPLLAGCMFFQAQFPERTRYLSYVLLAMLASTLKVRLPRITGTISVNFLFILIGIADFTMTETMTMGCAAIVIQCLWRAKRRPRLVQVVFNVAVLAISIGTAYQVSHFTLALARADSLSALLVIAACVFFLSNTLLISGVLCLIDGQPLKKTWEQCYLWSFPYYLVGSAVAGLVTVSSRAVGWEAALLVLPTMYLVYTFYRLFLERASSEADQLTLKTAA